jgi:preprotein translocase subunit SecB
MGESGVESAFQFLSYKIDTFHLDVTRDTRSLAHNAILDPSQVQMSLTLRNPIHIAADNTYVGGMDIQFSLFFSADRSESNRLAEGRAGISGYFRVVGNSFSKETEENLVKLQIPALLLPYLRPAVTSLLINAGFPGVVFPLINIHALASDARSKMTIQEATPLAPPVDVSQETK